jgi:hypothetical protein
MPAMETLRARILRRHLLIAAGLIVFVAVLGQFVLPPVAERVARGELDDDRAQVEIRAFPAWKLVFGHVDDLRVTTPTLSVSPDGLTDLLERARKVDAGDIAIGTLEIEGIPIAIRDVVARLDHGRVEASARFRISDVAAQLPAGATVVAAPPHPDGQPRLRASLEILGTKTEVPIVVRARGGRVEAAGETGITSAIRVPLFDNDALRIDELRGSVDGDVMTVRVRATLR